MAEWRNWANTVIADPRETLIVRDVEHLQAVVRSAHEAGQRVKAVGSGHSFTAIAEPTDVLIRMDRISGIESVDDATRRVWVRAGTPLHVLSPELWRRGLALPNLGDIDRQTLAGAVSTGTHGTGLGFQGMGAAVTGIELVLADGSVLRVRDQDDPDLVAGLVVGLGALGIVTAYQLQCVPAFLLRATEKPGLLEPVLDSLEETLTDADHFEFYWFPHTDLVQTKTNQVVSDTSALEPLPNWRARLDDDLLSNKLFEGINRLTTVAPRLIPAVNNVSGRALSARSYTDRSYLVFSTQRNVRFRESEFSVPRESLPSLLRELAAWTRERSQLVAFPVEVRFTGADDRWLSTSYGRESAYLAVHQYHRRDYEPYFKAFWSMLRDHEARPHWGKLHELTGAQLRPLYPRFDDFRGLRDRLDPDRVFTNHYLDTVLGA